MYDHVVLNCNALLAAVCINKLNRSAYASRFIEEELSEFLMKTLLSQHFYSLSEVECRNLLNKLSKPLYAVP